MDMNIAGKIKIIFGVLCLFAMPLHAEESEHKKKPAETKPKEHAEVKPQEHKEHSEHSEHKEAKPKEPKEHKSTSSLQLPEFRTAVIQNEKLIAYIQYEIAIQPVTTEILPKLTPHTSRIIDAVQTDMYCLMGVAYDRDEAIPLESINKRLTRTVQKVCPPNTIKSIDVVKYNVMPVEE